ncbi:MULTISPECIES: RNA-binding protein [Bacteroides]|uniref:RNA-binding protein n=1 Tax=Bacteroides acidifaciens TaxID=85831 RepID=A0A3L7Z8J2_9BACE|nr:RNA-binding protein [Bacteroides acidifaciens]RLT81820.1 RNA-binding protein [Bacteroides acidifaciens]
MDLHIKDRLLIPSIFPERGNFMDFNLKKSIARKIAISEQDRKDYEIVEKKEEKRIEWNVQKDSETPLVVEFSKEELDYMRRACEAITEQQMPDEMWAVVERIYNEAQN